jgi:hypothetical protein
VFDPGQKWDLLCNQLVVEAGKVYVIVGGYQPVGHAVWDLKTQLLVPRHPLPFPDVSVDAAW